MLYLLPTVPTRLSRSTPKIDATFSNVQRFKV